MKVILGQKIEIYGRTYKVISVTQKPTGELIYGVKKDLPTNKGLVVYAVYENNKWFLKDAKIL